MRVLAVSYFLPPALYPQAIQLWADDRLRVEGRQVRVLPAA